MVNISIDVTDLGGEARPGDKVVLWKPAAAGSSSHAGRVISTAPVDVFLTNGKASVPDVEPGSMRVLLQCRGVESQGPIDVTVPDGTGTVTLRSLIESQFEYAPPIVSAVQEAAANASASERAAIEAQVRSEAAADRADAKVDDAINNGAALVRNEVKQDADRAVAARQSAVQSESNAKASEDAAATSESNAAASESAAKLSETNAGDYAAVATTAATEAVDAMERATDLAGGDFATHEYVDAALDDPRVPQVRSGTDLAWAVTDGGSAALGVTTSGDTVIPRIDTSTRTMLLDTLGAADALHRSDAGLDIYPWRVADEDGAVPLAVTLDGAVDFRRLTPEAVAYIASIGRESNAPDPVWVPEPGGVSATYYPTGDSLTIPGAPTKTATVAGALTWEDSGVGWWQKTPEDGPWKIAETTRLAAWGSSSMFRLQRGLEAQLPGQGVTDILLGGGSGDRAEEIMWRMGMYEYHLAQVVTIPAEGSVTLTFAEGVPPGVRRVTDGATAGIMPGSLGGVHGRITLNTSGVITFTRITAGEQVTVPAGEEFEPDGRKYRDALAVLNIGKNNISGVEGDGRVSYEATVAAEQWLRSLSGRHLIMGHFNNWLWEDGDTRFREVAEANRLMAEHYGDRYIDLHGYIVSDQIWEDTGITPTDQDRADQDRGVIAHSLSADGSHADYAVSDVIVQKLIIDRMIQKGWL